MKAIKYLFVGALSLSFSAPVAAQEGSPVETVKAIINSNAADADKQVKAIYKKNKKNGEVVTGIARAYYEVKDTANARVYAEFATKLNYGPAYIVLGDISALADDGGGAAKMYDQAVYFAPKDPTGYYKYATVYRKVHLESAISKLDDLGVQRPDLVANGHVNVLKGRVYDLANKVELAAEVYNQVPLEQMEDRDVVSAARANFLLGNYKKSQEIIDYALQKNPRKFTYNQMGLFNYAQMKEYDKALEYADRMLNQSDSVKMNPEIYGVYANALNGAKRYDEAIKVYEQALTMEFDSQDKKAGLIKEMSKAYIEQKNFEKAIECFKQYMATLSQTSLDDYEDLGKYYELYAKSIEDADQRKAQFQEADKVYEEGIQKFPKSEQFLLYKRALVNTQIDPETTEGLAKPHFERLIELVNANAELNAGHKMILKRSYHYMAAYNFLLAKNYEDAVVFAQKLLELDPENAAGKAIIENAEQLIKK
jgi:tetratricopeptide (TPR) repeat protein